MYKESKSIQEEYPAVNQRCHKEYRHHRRRDSHAEVVGVVERLVNVGLPLVVGSAAQVVDVGERRVHDAHRGAVVQVEHAHRGARDEDVHEDKHRIHTVRVTVDKRRSTPCKNMDC